MTANVKNRVTTSCTYSSFSARGTNPRRALRPDHRTLAPAALPAKLGISRGQTATRALHQPSNDLDLTMLRTQSSRLGLPEDAAEELILFANLLAANKVLMTSQNLREQMDRIRTGREEAELRYGQAEARYGQAEARYGQAEARTTRALERVLTAENKSFRLEALAKDRYLKLVELRGSVNLREELRDILGEGAAVLVASRQQEKQPRPSVLEKWLYIFQGAIQQDPDSQAQDLLACSLSADRRLNSAEKAATAMVRIVENLDQMVHRSLPASVVKRIGGIAIEESALLGTQDCKLIECVMTWAAKPCRIIAKEEVDALIAEENLRAIDRQSNCENA